MNTIRPGFILSVCLIGALTGWLLVRLHSNHQVPSSPNQMAANSVPVPEAVAPAASPRESSAQYSVQSPQPTPEIRAAAEDPALANSESPFNSQDLDQNRDWARNFSDEARAWLPNAPDGEQRIAIAEIVCAQLAQTNPVAAVTLALNCFGSNTNEAAQGLLDSMAQQWAGQDLQAASTWVTTQPPGDERDGLVQRIAFVESKTNPSAAAQLVAQQIAPGPTQNEAAMSVLHQWAQQDANAAMTWAEMFPAGDFRDRAIHEVQNVNAVISGTQPAL